MHPNPVFHTQSDTANLTFARDRGFGLLSISAPEGAPLISHIPFLLSEDGSSIGLHLVRSNPIARLLRKGTIPARLAVTGPDSYVSPDWYDAVDQVPTWNYVAVHLWGLLELRPQTELLDLIDAQSAAFENRLLPKTPWQTAKMTPDARDSLMRQIVPCRMHVEGVDGTWKLNQNKPDDVRMRAADHVATEGLGSERALLAELMRNA